MAVSDIKPEIEQIAKQYAKLLKQEMNIDSIYLALI